MKEWVEGGIRALVCAEDLKASGLSVTESVIAGVSPVLAGNDTAVRNAERRIAKRIGEGWDAKLCGFDAASRRIVFEVRRGVEA